MAHNPSTLSLTIHCQVSPRLPFPFSSDSNPAVEKHAGRKGQTLLPTNLGHFGSYHFHSKQNSRLNLRNHKKLIYSFHFTLLFQEAVSINNDGFLHYFNSLNFIKRRHSGKNYYCIWVQVNLEFHAQTTSILSWRFSSGNGNGTRFRNNEIDGDLPIKLN